MAVFKRSDTTSDTPRWWCLSGATPPSDTPRWWCLSEATPPAILPAGGV